MRTSGRVVGAAAGAGGGTLLLAADGDFFNDADLYGLTTRGGLARAGDLGAGEAATLTIEDTPLGTEIDGGPATTAHGKPPFEPGRRG